MYGEFEKLKAIKESISPFPHLLFPNFIRNDVLDLIHRDFPKVPGAGSFPLASLNSHGAFAELIEEISSARMAEILADKLQVEIISCPTMVTVRGFCRKTDGKIHVDSEGKIVTVLLYLNKLWDGNSTGGRLRLLHGNNDLNDYFLEIPPSNGALLAFRCDENAWHGHLPYVGERRAIQLNWVSSVAYQRREMIRHVISASFKKVRASLFGKPTV